MSGPAIHGPLPAMAEALSLVARGRVVKASLARLTRSLTHGDAIESGHAFASLVSSIEALDVDATHAALAHVVRCKASVRSARRTVKR